MRQTLEELERQLGEERRRTMLCSGLSIEIEQVACAVMLASEALEKQFQRMAKTPAQEKLQRPFRALDNSALRLARIAENLNDLLACRQAKLAVRPQPVDLAWQYGRIAEQCRQSGKLEGIELEWECQLSDGQYVQADPVWADKVLLNLLSNALRCGTRVCVALKAGEEEYLLTVRDEGTGIEPAVRQHLFEPFVTSQAGQSSGAGLGLYLVHEYCDALGWRLELESGPEGTLVKVRIPRPAPGEAAALNSPRRDLAFCSAQDRRLAQELSVLQ